VEIQDKAVLVHAMKVFVGVEVQLLWSLTTALGRVGGSASYIGRSVSRYTSNKRLGRSQSCYLRFVGRWFSYPCWERN